MKTLSAEKELCPPFRAGAWQFTERNMYEEVQTFCLAIAKRKTKLETPGGFISEALLHLKYPGETQDEGGCPSSSIKQYFGGKKQGGGHGARF